MFGLAQLRQRIMGHPFVYERIRPLVVGGIDLSPAYRNLACTAEDVVVDIGCGTGDALNYLTEFRAYHGFDNDAGAVAHARTRFGTRPGVHYSDRELQARDLAEIQPTRVMMAGLLHHLDDQLAIDLLRMCAAAPSVRRIATLDVVYLPGEHVNNLLARLDRGKYVRKVDGYKDLVQRAGLKISRDEIARSNPTRGKALYYLMAIETGR